MPRTAKFLIVGDAIHNEVRRLQMVLRGEGHTVECYPADAFLSKHAESACLSDMNNDPDFVVIVGAGSKYQELVATLHSVLKRERIEGRGFFCMTESFSATSLMHSIRLQVAMMPLASAAEKLAGDPELAEILRCPAALT